MRAINKLPSLLVVGLSLLTASGLMAETSQYNMSLQNQVVTGSKGELASPQAVAVNEHLDVVEKQVQEVAKGIYRISGWGIANIIAVEGAEGWIIIDSGDYLEVAWEQRKALEDKVGKINVVALLYTHSHYALGAKAWHDEGARVYAHEDLVQNMNADMGVSVLTGNFNTRALIQFGMLHPQEGPDAFPNHLGFSVAKLSGTKAFVPPDVTFKDDVVEKHTIAGLRVEVLPSKTDVKDSVAYYFPEQKLLVSNGLTSEVIFNLYTLRGDWYRNPMDYVEAVDLALSRDITLHVDIHGSAKIGHKEIIASLQKVRDQMQLVHDQTYRAIALGKDAQGAAETVYMPAALRDGKENYGQLESHVKRVYGARIGWMGWDVYDINPLSNAVYNSNIIQAMGGYDVVLKAAQDASARQTLEDWQWSLYLSSQLLLADADNAAAKTVRAEAARALGQRTTSANARGFYISEALLHEGKLQFGGHIIDDYQQLSQALGAVTADKLAKSPLNDNVHYLRYMVDPRLAEGKRVEFNINFTDENISYAIALRNGIIAITGQPNDGVTIELVKANWSQLITGEKSFESVHHSLNLIDEAIAR